MALTTHGTAAIVFVARVVVRGRRARRCSSAAFLDGARVTRLMAGTVSRFHRVFPWLRQGRDSMRYLPLKTDGELKHQQRGDHPVCGSVTHDSQRTPAAVTRTALGAALTGRRRQPKRLQWQFVFGRSQRGMTCELCKS